jgi:hypothetical protein
MGLTRVRMPHQGRHSKHFLLACRLESEVQVPPHGLDSCPLRYEALRLGLEAVWQMPAQPGKQLAAGGLPVSFGA